MGNSRLLESVEPTAREAFLALAHRRRYSRNEAVCHEGDPADSLHLVADGLLSVAVGLETGQQLLLNLLGPGDCFGELALLRGDGLRTATVRALRPTETLVVTASAFGRVRAEHPAVDRALLELLADRVDTLGRRLLDQTYLTLQQRLCHRLLALAGPGGTDQVTLTQGQLAELVGGTRPTVNQVLGRLEEQGVVRRVDGHVEVLDGQRLRAKAGHD